MTQEREEKIKTGLEPTRRRRGEEGGLSTFSKTTGLSVVASMHVGRQSLIPRTELKLTNWRGGGGEGGGGRAPPSYADP